MNKQYPQRLTFAEAALLFRHMPKSSWIFRREEFGNSISSRMGCLNIESQYRFDDDKSYRFAVGCYDYLNNYHILFSTQKDIAQGLYTHLFIMQEKMFPHGERTKTIQFLEESKLPEELTTKIKEAIG